MDLGSLSLSLESGLMIVAGIALLWFLSRNLAGKGTGASLTGMFRRESKMPVIGVGREAIATLLSDFQAFIAGEAALRSLVLMGEFAGRVASSDSTVILLTFCATPKDYSDPLWRARWAYPAKGHLVIDHAVSEGEGWVEHQMHLRGAPKIRFLVLSSDHFAQEPPDSLRDALVHRAILIDDPSGIAGRTIKAWRQIMAATDNEIGRDEQL